MRAAFIAGLFFFAVAPGTAFAQVNVRALTVVPDIDAVAGQSINLVVTFQSDDVQPMPPFRWRAYLTLNGALDGATPLGGLVGPVDLGTGGQPQVFSAARTIPAAVGGGFFTIVIVADDGDAISEVNEYDNVAIAGFASHVVAQAPDLELTAGTASPLALRAGEAIDLDFTITNRGQVAATVAVGAHLSADPVVSPSDPQLGTQSVAVAAGATVNGSISGVVPLDAYVGDHAIGFIADPAGAVVESDETNNLFYATTLNVFEDTLALITETVPQATLTIPYYLQLVADGGDGHYEFAVISGALPNGVTLSPTGLLDGEPVRTGSYDFEIEVSSAGLSDRQAYSVEVVSTFQPLRIATDHVDDAYHRYPYQQVLVAGGGEPPYQWTLTADEGTLPPGLDLSTSGVISGIPSQLGVFDFGVTVQDRLGATDSLHYQIEVTPLATVLILNTLEPVGVAGEPFDYELHATGGVAPYRWEAASTPPPGLSVTEDGRISGTPEMVGLWPLRIRVYDSTSGGASDTALFQIDIRDESDFHFVTTELPAGLVRSVYRMPIDVTGGDPPYRFSLLPGDTLPDGFFLTQGDGDEFSTDTGLVVGRAFRPLVHPFSVVVEDARGRQRQLPFAVVISAGDASFNAGCICVARPADPDGGPTALVLLGVLLSLGCGARRFRSRSRSPRSR